MGFGGGVMKLFRWPMALVAALATATLAGCGGGSDLQTASIAAGPLAPGKARVTITRPSSIVYAAAPATITLNGQKVADIAVGSSAVVDVPAGANVLAASAWSYPGSFSVKLDAKAGATYALSVEPRGDSLLPGALLGPIGGAIDASVNENAGAFQLTVVPGTSTGSPSPAVAAPAAPAKGRTGS